MKIELIGNKLIIEFPIDGVHDAYIRAKSKKIVKCTPQHLEGIKKYEQHLETGKLTTRGTVVVHIDTIDLVRLGWSASDNKNQRSKLGPARASFKGARKWEVVR